MQQQQGRPAAVHFENFVGEKSLCVHGRGEAASWPSRLLTLGGSRLAQDSLSVLMASATKICVKRKRRQHRITVERMERMGMAQPVSTGLPNRLGIGLPFPDGAICSHLAKKLLQRLGQS